MGANAGRGNVELGALRRACGFCSLRELCWPIGLEPDELERLQSMVRHAGPLQAGRYLFHSGDRFTAIYAVRTGCIKSYSLDATGHELVHGFHVRGELLGFDAVHPDRHRCNALVLEDSTLCVIPYRDIARLALEFESLQSQVLRLMSREFSKQLMFAEGSGAEQRVAIFLLDMQHRLCQPGGDEYSFRLPMSREDIASFLGIKPETLSRLIGKIQGKDLIEIDRRQVRIVDPLRLDMLAQGIRLG